MPARLKIDLAQGLLEVEGEDDFVREVFDKFRASAQQWVPKTTITAASLGGAEVDTVEPGSASVPATTKSRRRRKMTVSSADDTTKRASAASYEPRMDQNLKPDGLAEFIAPFAPSSHPEHILVFAMYLRQRHNLETVTADQIYTCYRFAKVKWARAYLQSLRDAQSKKLWIAMEDPLHIRVTNLGEQYFEHDMKRVSITE